MKALAPGLQAHLDTGATTLCACWKLTRADNMVFGFTDHDRDLAFDSVTFEAAAGFTATAIESSAGLNVDNLDVLGALTSSRLNDVDLAAGLYDNADIEIWRVNWADVTQRVLMRKGNLGEVSRGRGAFTAEVRGLAHKLNQPTGRLYQYACDVDLGSAKCGIDLKNATYKGAGTVLTAADNRTLTASGLNMFADDWFTRGQVTFTGGANLAASMEVKAHTFRSGVVTVELWQPMARTVAVSDTFDIRAGCDKQFATCRDKFANAVNFRGFPHMPGNDFVISYPTRGQGNDGRSRL